MNVPIFSAKPSRWLGFKYHQVRAFFRAAEEADFHGVYQHHKSVLQLASVQAPRRRWVLKYPIT